jgi:hypothetical protein
VSPAKQFYHCFGCGKHGSAIKFLMDYDRLEFVDAVCALDWQATVTGRAAPLHDVVFVPKPYEAPPGVVKLASVRRYEVERARSHAALVR